MTKEFCLYSSVDDWIYTETDGIVQSGPFKGMLLLREQDWKDGNLSTKCLGCYEEELHSIIEYEIDRLSKLEKPKVVDIGCAEGYYTIGLARRLPQAIIYGVDISKTSLQIANKAAEMNGVAIKTDMVLEEVMKKPDFVVVDVEGDEVNYLRPDWFVDLVKSDILVECHDCDELHVTEILHGRFKDTHHIDCIVEGGRNPNKYKILQGYESLHRWMAVCEGRPCMMHWLFMKAKQ